MHEFWCSGWIAVTSHLFARWLQNLALCLIHHHFQWGLCKFSAFIAENGRATHIPRRLWEWGTDSNERDRRSVTHRHNPPHTVRARGIQGGLPQHDRRYSTSDILNVTLRPLPEWIFRNWVWPGEKRRKEVLWVKCQIKQMQRSWMVPRFVIFSWQRQFRQTVADAGDSAARDPQ